MMDQAFCKYYKKQDLVVNQFNRHNAEIERLK